MAGLIVICYAVLGRCACSFLRGYGKGIIIGEMKVGEVERLRK